MQPWQKSIGRKKAIALADSGWWIDRPAREIAKFQLFTTELCMPFDTFHRALEFALGRSIWTHEFALNLDGLMQEFLDERDPPSMEEIFSLIPLAKRKVIFLEEAH